MKDDNSPTIERIVELQQLIADFGDVKRYIKFADKGHLETDVEHSYGLAMTAWFMAIHFAPNLDVGKILKYALTHDLVEIYAGDTFVFDADKVATKKSREAKALEKLKNDLPDFLEAIKSTEGYINKIDEEARFVYTVDKILPPLMVVLSGDKEFWKRNKITHQMHLKEKENKMNESPELTGWAGKLNKYLANRESFYDESI